MIDEHEKVHGRKGIGCKLPLPWETNRAREHSRQVVFDYLEKIPPSPFSKAPMKQYHRIYQIPFALHDTIYFPLSLLTPSSVPLRSLCFIMCMCMPVYVHMHADACLSQRGIGISWIWNYGQLWAAKHRSLKLASSPLQEPKILVSAELSLQLLFPLTLFCFWDGFWHGNSGWPRTYCVAQANSQ